MEDPRRGGKPITSWQDLGVWKHAHGLVLMVYELARELPHDERFRLIDQLCRAVMSVPTNIVEGKSRSSVKEYLQYLAIARGSVEEVKYLLLLGKDLGYVRQERHAQVTAECETVGRMLNGLMRALRLVANPRTQVLGQTPPSET